MHFVNFQAQFGIFLRPFFFSNNPNLLKQNIHTISFTLRCPPENTMAFGGVATGNMKANEQEMAAGSIRYQGWTPISSPCELKQSFSGLWSHCGSYTTFMFMFVLIDWFFQSFLWAVNPNTLSQNLPTKPEWEERWSPLQCSRSLPWMWWSLHTR